MNPNQSDPVSEPSGHRRPASNDIIITIVSMASRLRKIGLSTLGVCSGAALAAWTVANSESPLQVSGCRQQEEPPCKLAD